VIWLLWACSAPAPSVEPEPAVVVDEEAPVASTPLVIGHRGAPGHLPDHTLEGYRLAAQMGADFLEPDLVPTKDGHLVARHENDLTHTTDVAERFPERRTTKTIDGQQVTGFFSEDFTLEEIRTLRAVQPYASRPHDHDGRYRVPTLEEVLALRAELSEELGRPVGVYPETKHPSYFRSLGLPLEPPLVDALRRHGLTDEDDPVFLQSFEPSSLLLLGSQLRVRRVLLVGDLEATPVDDERTYGALLADLPALRSWAHAIGVHTSHVWGPDGPTDLVDRAHGAGLAVHVYTFRMEPDKLGHAAQGDPRRELKAFYDLGVDGVFADYPDVAVEVRGR
jgi:glycerophosphoryl diester phosphodiesterase